MEMRQISVRIRQYDISTSDNTAGNSNNTKSYMSEDILLSNIRGIKTKMSAHEGGIQTTKHRDTTSTCHQDMEERGEEAETRKRRYRNTDMHAIEYATKETLSRQDTETQKGQEKERRLHKESTNAKKGKGRRRRGGVGSPCYYKKKKVR